MIVLAAAEAKMGPVPAPAKLHVRSNRAEAQSGPEWLIKRQEIGAKDTCTCSGRLTCGRPEIDTRTSLPNRPRPLPLQLEIFLAAAAIISSDCRDRGKENKGRPPERTSGRAAERDRWSFGRDRGRCSVRPVTGPICRDQSGPGPEPRRR